MQELISRQEAIAKGLFRYFTGEPCKHGHVTERNVKNCTCYGCAEVNGARVRANTRELAARRSREWHAANPEKSRINRRRQQLKRYGLTLNDFERMRQDQQDCCVICTLPFVETPRVDHCHATGKVRGLLCRHCNTLLGQARDSIETLSRAIAYLQATQK